jgi:hypothetical protein
MQFKVESEMTSTDGAVPRGQDRSNRTSSVYISNGSVNAGESSVVSDERQKPVLTIQVNQNQNIGGEHAKNNLVNIVSCFRATNTAAAATITHGIENIVHNKGSSSGNLPFNVSVNRSNHGNCEKAPTGCSDESVSSDHNKQSVVNIVADFSSHLNDITIAPNATSTVDYTNVALDDGGVHAKIDKAASESAINQITIVNDNDGDGGGGDDGVLAVESVNNQIAKVVDENSQTFREQRRRERRERRQARQRAAQHGQHHRHHVSVHPASRSSARAEQRMNGYEMLPDIINNHLPPPYSTLPIHQLALVPPPPPPPTHLPPPPPPIIAAPLPVVVDDCRFSFPIPIIRR